MSMFVKATKRTAKARVALAGPTGSGKTWTALIWATTLGKKIAFVDTERGSASLYSDHFTFDVLEMTPPYEPKRLVDALKAAEADGYDVIVADSLSHFWEGEGGTLDIADAAGSRAQGNSFAGWKVATPELRHLVDTMLGLDAHLIVTMRSKMEYVLEEDSRGKKVPRKVGMAPVMRAGVEYEFTLVGDMDLEHRLTISKSRCDRLADLVIQPGRANEAAETFLNWLNEGEASASRNDVDAIRARISALDEKGKEALRDVWEAASLPQTRSLLASQVARANELIDGIASTAGDGSGGPGATAPAPEPADGDVGEGELVGAPDPTPEPEPAKKTTAAKKAAPRTRAQDLHIEAAKAVKSEHLEGIDAELLLDAVILVITRGSTTSAANVTGPQSNHVVRWLNKAAQGELDIQVRFDTEGTEYLAITNPAEEVDVVDQIAQQDAWHAALHEKGAA